MVSTRSSTRRVVESTPAESPSPAVVNGTGKNKKRRGENAVHDADLDSGLGTKRQRVVEPVDRTRWRMKADGGRHTWHYLDDAAAAEQWPQSYADKWYLDLPMVRGMPLYPNLVLVIAWPLTKYVLAGLARPSPAESADRRRPQWLGILRAPPATSWTMGL